jgi:Sedlin, N-terminal conserved region
MMSVLGIAILGKRNEPLYLCDTALLQEVSDSTKITKNDHFGFSSTLLEQRNSLPLSRQLTIHAALDWIEELVDVHNGLMPVVRTSNQHPHWLGLLYQVDDADGQAIYGYITATNIKFVVLLSNGDKTIENSVKELLADIHQSYIAYVMNPFSNTGGPIVSRRFDDNLKVIVSDFEKSIMRLCSI